MVLPILYCKGLELIKLQRALGSQCPINVRIHVSVANFIPKDTTAFPEFTLVGDCSQIQLRVHVPLNIVWQHLADKISTTPRASSLLPDSWRQVHCCAHSTELNPSSVVESPATAGCSITWGGKAVS